VVRQRVSGPPLYAENLICGLGRLAGHDRRLANQPRALAGVLDIAAVRGARFCGRA
jgi:acetyl-CoA carboxylase carboxyltransferase component